MVNYPADLTIRGHGRGPCMRRVVPAQVLGLSAGPEPVSGHRPARTPDMACPLVEWRRPLVQGGEAERSGRRPSYRCLVDAAIRAVHHRHRWATFHAPLSPGTQGTMNHHPGFDGHPLVGNMCTFLVGADGVVSRLDDAQTMACAVRAAALPDPGAGSPRRGPPGFDRSTPRCPVGLALPPPGASPHKSGACRTGVLAGRCPLTGSGLLRGLRPSPTRHAVDRCRFERKLSQGPAVRWADRHHSLPCVSR